MGGDPGVATAIGVDRRVDHPPDGQETNGHISWHGQATGPDPGSCEAPPDGRGQTGVVPRIARTLRIGSTALARLLALGAIAFKPLHKGSVPARHTSRPGTQPARVGAPVHIGKGTMAT